MWLKLWEYIKASPIQFFLILIGIYVGMKILLYLMRHLHRYRASKNLVFLRVTMPRADSAKDKEQQNEKDFREKISVMAQFFRNLHETREINMMNTIRTRLFKNNIFTFELVAHQKVLDFYVTTPKYYQDIVEKQITSYYPNADVQPMERYEHKFKDSKIKGFYAYLNKTFWFPIKTFKVVENDPLNDLTNIFTKLTEEETAVIQLVVRPIGPKWAKKATAFGEAFFKGKKTGGIKIPIIGALLSLLLDVVKGIFTGYKPDAAKQGGDGYVRMLQAKEEVAKRIGEKASQSGFDTVIRLLASAKTEKRAEDISNNIIVGLNLFKDSVANWFQTKRLFFIDSLNDKWFLYNFRNRYMDTKLLFLGEKKSIMVEEELASVYHFPSSKYNKSPNIRWLAYKVLPPPTNLPTEGILLGHNTYRGNKREVRFMRKDRSRHHYIIGKSGSGKSALLSYMARQDIWNGDGVCVIDPHGDLVEDILSYCPKERAKDVIIFDPSDLERPMSINMLKAKTPEEIDLISSQATEIFIKLFGDEIFGPRIQHYFRNACLTLMEDPDEGATLIDIPRVFTDEAFLKYKVSKVKNPVVKSFWQNEYANTGDREKQEMIPYFSSKFGPFITNTIMRNTIGQKESSFNFRKVMDSQSILMVKLSKGTIGDLNTQLLGLVMVAKIQMAAMSRNDMPEDQRKDFYLYVDEFQNFATDSFCSILSEARKYHLCLIMAHQYINQLVVSKTGSTNTQIRDAVFGNVGSMASFKVGADDAEYLAKEYSPVLTEQDVINVANYKMYMKLNINNATSRPFSVSTIWDTAKQSHKVAKLIKDYSRLKHGRKKSFVEQEIITRIGIGTDSGPAKLEASQGPNAAGPAGPPGGDMAAMLGGAMPPGAAVPPTPGATPPAAPTATKIAEPKAPSAPQPTQTPTEPVKAQPKPVSSPADPVNPPPEPAKPSPKVVTTSVTPVEPKVPLQEKKK